VERRVSVDQAPYALGILPHCVTGYQHGRLVWVIVDIVGWIATFAEGEITDDYTASRNATLHDPPES